MIISFVGFAESGKSTAASVLKNNGYIQMNFADAIKDCLSAIFGWPRHLLEGDTKESREFRETVDHWWAEKLEIPTFTPRYAMKFFGTDVIRKYFHQDLWVFCIERRILPIKDQPIVIGDVRHMNEMDIVKKYGGKNIRIKKGSEPEWFDIAMRANIGDKNAEILMNNYQIHSSERAWIGYPVDHTIENNGSIIDLINKVNELI